MACECTTLRAHLCGNPKRNSEALPFDNNSEDVSADDKFAACPTLLPWYIMSS